MLGTGPDSLRINQIGLGWMKKGDSGPSILWRVYISFGPSNGK